MQQRLHDEEDARLQQSVLAELLLNQLAWGIFSTAQVEDVANKAIQDMESVGLDVSVFPELYALARAGTFGKHPNNIHRDIMNHVKDKIEFTAFEPHLPFKTIGEQPTKINLPHEHFAYLYNHQPEAFREQILPNTLELHRFWREVRQHPAVKDLPESDLEYMVPIGLHGDEVPVVGVGKVWSKAALTFQYFSILAHAVGTPTILLLQWIWSTFEVLCIPGEDGTIHTFMKIMKWSWNALYTGKWPTHDWKGTKQLAWFLSFCCVF